MEIIQDKLNNATPLAELMSNDGYYRVNVFRSGDEHFYTLQTQGAVCPNCEHYSWSQPVLCALHTADWETELKNVIDEHNMSIQYSLFH